MSIQKIVIENSVIYLEDLGPNRGQITVTNPNQNYSMFWGAMGGNLREFLLSINKDYFSSKLMGARRETELDVRKTFAQIRKHIKQDIGLVWYDNKEFHEIMRSELKSYQDYMEEHPSGELLVNSFFNTFVDRLPFYLLDDKFFRKQFNDIEPWNFLIEKPNREYLWLCKLHGKLKKELKRQSSPINK